MITDTLTSKVEEEIDAVSFFVASGKCTDWGHYRERCGHITGLRRTLGILHDLTQPVKQEAA